MTRSARLAAAAAGALLLAAQPLVAVAAPAQEAPGTPPELPGPTGPHAVGVQTLHLVDESREDPWVPSTPRELMVDLWYPAAGDPGGDTAQYMTPEESRLFIEFQEEMGGSPPVEVPKDLLSTVRTNAHPDAAPLATEDGHPLVVLSPAFTYPRASLSGMAEELASKGFAVALVGHNHESAGTAFPDGRVTGCEACTDENVPRVPAIRAKDVSFMLDELAEQHDAVVDDERVAMVGHSIGGASASETMERDERVDAGLNLDGTFFDPVEKELDKPFLMLGAGQHAPNGIDASWDETWEKLTGWKRWMTLNGANHGSSTDLSMLAEQAGIPFGSAPIDARRGTELSNEVVAAFVGTHLRGEHHPMLDLETEERPELLFWHLDRPERLGR